MPVSGDQTKSLADILLEHRFVDEVIAPVHAIDDTEALAALVNRLNGRPLSELRTADRQWKRFVMIGERAPLA